MAFSSLRQAAASPQARQALTQLSKSASDALLPMSAVPSSPPVADISFDVDSSSGGHAWVLWLVLVILVCAGIAGGAVWYKRRKSVAQK